LVIPVRGVPIAVLLLAAALIVPAASAQTPAHDVLYHFQILTPGGNRADVPINGQVLLPVTFHDFSRDDTSTLPPVGGAPSDNVLFHQVTWDVVPAVDDAGWTVFPPAGIISFGGQDHVVQVPFQVTAQAKHPFYQVQLVAHVRVQDGTVYDLNTTLVGFSLGANSFSAQISASLQLHPMEIAEVPVRLINLGIGPRSFDMNVTSNDCNMGVATSNNNLVLGKSEAVYNVSIQAPASKLYYASQSCTIILAVSPSTNHDIVQNAVIAVQVAGWYVNPVWVFDLLFLLLLILLLILFVRRRKERIEEEILGKPQKPWTIPVEVLYLKALRQKDPRAWYVVRHYLMEDEYRSALLWYHSYKKSTKGDRRKEGLVLRQEKSYERWKKGWTRTIARPIKEAERYEARLQRKLDRQAKGAHAKQVGKARKVTAKMRAAHAAQVERAGKAHGKAVAKAQKKGVAPPKRPVIPTPDYPEEPALVPIPLSTHKWAKKAGKFRAKMVRKQGDLEVKFEKADARQLRKIRRKVAKVARKLDDPEFVDAHPLLKGA
jgi:hypothetical protein